MDEGVSLFLYRIYQNGAWRTPTGRLLPGRRQDTKLPIEFPFLMTAWAKKASLQHEIAGWMMRVLEDNATLPASLLNAYQADVFQPDESVDIILTELSVEDMFHLWEVMINHVYQLSVPYQARIPEIESPLLFRRVLSLTYDTVGRGPFGERTALAGFGRRLVRGRAKLSLLSRGEGLNRDYLMNAQLAAADVEQNNWYVLMVRSNHEKRMRRGLTTGALITFFPVTVLCVNGKTGASRSSCHCSLATCLSESPWSSACAH